MNTIQSTSTASTESPRTAILDFTAWSPRTASLIAGISLGLMPFLMGVGYFGIILPAITAGNAAKTATAVADSGLVFLVGVGLVFVVTLLDIIAAAAVYTLFKPVNQRRSAVAAWLRVGFAVIFMVALIQLVNGYFEPADALASFESFSTIWIIGLGVFGAYLMLTGYLAYRSGFVARVFGILLVIAGLGYLADALGTAVAPDFTAVFGQFLFVGEVAFIFWLLIRGTRLK